MKIKGINDINAKLIDVMNKYEDMLGKSINTLDDIYHFVGANKDVIYNHKQVRKFFRKSIERLNFDSQDVIDYINEDIDFKAFIGITGMF